jgi:hypothetical protein
MESKIYKTCGCECKNCNNINIRKCKKCNFEGQVNIYFYKTGKGNSYRYICKKCYLKKQNDNTDNDIKYFETDFEDLPKEIKLKIFHLTIEHKNIKEIARQSKCKYNMIWYAVKSKQIEKFAKLYFRI